MALLLKAAEAGDGNAMNLIGLVHRDGTVSNPDANEAVRWFRSSMEAGKES
jgi:TPR repeat protein